MKLAGSVEGKPVYFALQHSSAASSSLRILSPRKVIFSLLGSMILAFGLYNVHSLSSVTEGGVLGLTLLLKHLTGISPAVTSVILTAACYAFGIKTLGKEFVVYSAFSGGGFALFYAVFERFPPVYPDIALYPVAAAFIGAVFVGVGVGLCVRAGGAPTGDDALAMSLSKKTGIKIQYIYLISDLTVLAASLCYIPPKKLLYSLITVVLSGQIIGFFDKKEK